MRCLVTACVCTHQLVCRVRRHEAAVQQNACSDEYTWWALRIHKARSQKSGEFNVTTRGCSTMRESINLTN
jgi:hypothetical protein